MVSWIRASPLAGFGRSSPAVDRAIMHGHLWSPSYFSASCGGASLTIVRQCIEQQKRLL
ncbi:transposase [Streptomyces sp. NPDC001221]